jgi:predicted RNA-binding protein with PIN domain
VPDPTLYLFDGYNVMHAGGFADAREVVDTLASFVALRGARGVVVFDGVGTDVDRGQLQVRYVAHADVLLERLAAEHRSREQVCLVSSDAAVRGTSGQEVMKISSQTFVADLEPTRHEDRPTRGLGHLLDDETRARLERLRRGRPD